MEVREREREREDKERGSEIKMEEMEKRNRL